jgi:hypothetical protein
MIRAQYSTLRAEKLQSTPRRRLRPPRWRLTHGLLDLFAPAVTGKISPKGAIAWVGVMGSLSAAYFA